ncbi:hypothetical protein Patl1_26784 [Pistacia atlantica]|uniref:Uncharacterized protein n=1 Tax=Pistacia atlantica TaxID=434234 RepID=A0ACC1B1D8_9ROSI|nr:hypothetical protein Patl1_26784 [Pistacia atlantica]
MCNSVWIQFFFIIFLIIFHNFQASTFAFDEDRLIRIKFKVHIINGLSSNENPLIIHCYSNDDDLGEHTLWMNNEFKFRFGNHVWRLTHFWCVMRCGLNKKTIDVFRSGVETKTCRRTGNCFWSAREEGFYFSNDNQSWVKRYDWF